MKKILFAIPLLAAMFASCEPAVDEISKGANVTAEQLTSSFELVAKSAGNNNITIKMNPVHYVWVYDASTDIVIAQGTNPVVQIVPPAREVGIYLSTINQDGTIIKSSPKTINVTEFTDLPDIYYSVFGEDLGTTTWTWDTEASNGVWGNGGYMESTGPDWWRVSAAEIDEQAEGKGLPADGLDGWFSISLTGVQTSRGETGSVSVTEDVVKAGWDIGTMKFTGTIPLMGILTNQGNARQYDYQILQADDNVLRLCAPEPGAGDWGTAWFWNFKKKQ